MWGPAHKEGDIVSDLLRRMAGIWLVLMLTAAAAALSGGTEQDTGPAAATAAPAPTHGDFCYWPEQALLTELFLRRIRGQFRILDVDQHVHAARVVADRLLAQGLERT